MLCEFVTWDESLFEYNNRISSNQWYYMYCSQREWIHTDHSWHPYLAVGMFKTHPIDCKQTCQSLYPWQWFLNLCQNFAKLHRHIPDTKSHTHTDTQTHTHTCHNHTKHLHTFKCYYTNKECPTVQGTCVIWTMVWYRSV